MISGCTSTERFTELDSHMEERGEDDVNASVWGRQIVYHVSRKFGNVRVTDMGVDNIGKSVHGSIIESSEKNKVIIESSDLILATGSSLVNGSIDNIVGWSSGKPLHFYGVTVAAAAYQFGLNRLCFEAL